ncbi:hypothetical protein GNI_006800 [Gregarina niphandrodes]|uniref:Uncharacterized protein n=1 Tax=Gregarina niphandrodes TaxID=110365 RepID=A0A023BD74_GRENI|nr:hypothetical protein GNI_006800 [Gregarina niphandrodes]EZG87443.1 hypothetical protein GNI_006800 [Gregarina niphandrodes]|eukprot:XP_011128648.1 hypothetical protein GNI_006800 [Gregarina niphandrodes]
MMFEGDILKPALFLGAITACCKNELLIALEANLTYIATAGGIAGAGQMETIVRFENRYLWSGFSYSRDLVFTMDEPTAQQLIHRCKTMKEETPHLGLRSIDGICVLEFLVSSDGGYLSSCTRYQVSILDDPPDYRFPEPHLRRVTAEWEQSMHKYNWLSAVASLSAEVTLVLEVHRAGLNTLRQQCSTTGSLIMLLECVDQISSVRLESNNTRISIDSFQALANQVEDDGADEVAHRWTVKLKAKELLAALKILIDRAGSKDKLLRSWLVDGQYLLLSTDLVTNFDEAQFCTIITRLWACEPPPWDEVADP